MSPILHTAGLWLVAHAAPLLALAIALAGAWLGRGKSGAAYVPAAGALALLAGWGWLAGAASLPRAIWAPHRGIEVLLAPAAVCIFMVLAAIWRGGRNRRLLLLLGAGAAGWLVAKASVGTTDFFRVVFAVLLLSWWFGWAIRGEAPRGLAASLALWGGLLAADAGSGWVAAAAVAAAAWAGLLAAGKGATLPSATMAALIVAADVAGGRALRGRIDAVDLACLAACVAPHLTGVLAEKFGAKSNRFLPDLSALLAASILSAVVWFARRAISG